MNYGFSIPKGKEIGPCEDHRSGGHGEHGGMAMGPAVAPEEAGVVVEMKATPESPAP